MCNRHKSPLHFARQQAVELIFEKVPSGAFGKGLELGAGDGYQSRFLKRYISQLICTEYDLRKLCDQDEEIAYAQCDAELVDLKFGPQEFDVVFSSNVFQYLPNPQLALKGIANVLKEDGIAILVMTNPTWRLFKLLCFYPSLVVRAAKKIRRLFGGELGSRIEHQEQLSGDNQKRQNRYGRLRQKLFPTPFGAYNSSLEELFKSRKSRWTKELEVASLTIVKIIKTPFMVGDLTVGLNAWFDRLGLTTEYIYIARKSRNACPYVAYWE